MGVTVEEASGGTPALEAPSGAVAPAGAPAAQPAPPADIAESARVTPDQLTLGPAPGPIMLTDALAVAGRKAMWVQLDRLVAREPGVRDPERPDELRKYRVAIRRLRAAMRVFAPAYPKREIQPLRRALRDLARSVGVVRDLDLRIADLNRWALERGGEAPAGVTVLSAAWARDRQRGADSLLSALDSKCHRRLLARLTAFVDGSSQMDPVPGGPPVLTVGDRLASQLWAAYEDVRAFGPVLQSANLETIHDLRIAAKRLRDDLELLAPVLPREREWLAERLVALQDHLGALNDAAVAATAVRAFVEHKHAARGGAERTEIAHYLVDREREVEALRRSISQPWRPIARISFARRLSRLVVVGPAG